MICSNSRRGESSFVMELCESSVLRLTSKRSSSNSCGIKIQHYGPSPLVATVRGAAGLWKCRWNVNVGQRNLVEVQEPFLEKLRVDTGEHVTAEDMF